MWVLKIAEGLFFEGVQGADNQHLATHRRDAAKKFPTRQAAAQFAVENNLTADARPVPVWEDEQREKR